MICRTPFLSRVTSSYVTNVAQLWQRTQLRPVIHLFIWLFKHLRVFWLLEKKKTKLSILFGSRMEWSGKMEEELQEAGWVLCVSDSVILWTKVPESYPF